MRIVIVGANGQVASEVTLLLASRPEIEVRPLVRTRSGSSFLRFHGIRVIHGAIIDSEFAVKALQGADVVASLALAGGTPANARAENNQIVESIFAHAPPSATIVFFSTLAVLGRFDYSSRRTKSVYANVKLENERLVASLSKRLDRRAFILRLGHVIGDYQPITQLIREEISAPPVRLPDAERDSNVTHVVAIADALMKIGRGEAGAPGLYDLVNMPQWSWLQVYEREASVLHVPLKLCAAHSQLPSRQFEPKLKAAAFGLIRSLRLRSFLDRAIAALPGSLNDRIRADYLVDRALSEIASLNRPQVVRNSASLWPSLPVRPLSGLTPTLKLLDDRYFHLSGLRERWPDDLLLVPDVAAGVRA